MEARPKAEKYLRSTGRFNEPTLRRLLKSRFTGDVWAVPEGRVVFASEPLLEVEAPVLEAQLVETLLLSAVYYPTLVATKAARCVNAASGKSLVDFGMRRMPGPEASVVAARAAYLAGFAATSNVLAGRELGIPVSGTVGHSVVELFTSELEAFRGVSAVAPDGVTLVVDTYDATRGVGHAIEVARELTLHGRTVAAIRLDSGELVELSRRARRMLDEAGLFGIRIVASGGLDEYELARLEAEAAPIDGYGIGTRLGMSADVPVIDMAYKIASYEGRPCLKLSEGKATLAGPKQVWRRRSGDGELREDLLATRDEPAPGPDWEPLLERVMTKGRARLLPDLAAVRERREREMRSLPRDLLRPEPADRPFPVHLSAKLAEYQQRAVASIKQRERIDPRAGSEERATSQRP